MSRGCALGLGGSVAALAIVTWQVIAGGPLVRLDYTVHNRRIDLHHPHAHALMEHLVMLGQRGPAMVPLLLVAGLLARRNRTWRPVVVCVLALLALTLLVGAGKLWIGRLRPIDGSAAVFAPGGIIYPSGHAANAVLSFGLLAWLLVRYGPARRLSVGLALTALVSFVVGMASVYLDTHWVSDLLAGWLAGATVLFGTMWVDHVTSRTETAAITRTPVALVTDDVPG